MDLIELFSNYSENLLHFIEDDTIPVISKTIFCVRSALLSCIDSLIFVKKVFCSIGGTDRIYEKIILYSYIFQAGIPKDAECRYTPVNLQLSLSEQSLGKDLRFQHGTKQYYFPNQVVAHLVPIKHLK